MKHLSLATLLFTATLSFGQQTYSLSAPLDYDIMWSVVTRQTDMLADGGDLFSVGTVCGSGSGTTVWMVRHTPQQIVWSQQLLIPNAYSENSAYAEIAAFPNSTDLLMVVKISGAGGANLLVHRINRQDGSLIWSKKLHCSATDFAYMETNGIAIDEQEEIIVTFSLGNFMQVAQFSGEGELLAAHKVNNIGEEPGKNPGFSFRKKSSGGYLATFKDDVVPTIASLNEDLSVQWSKEWMIEGYTQPRSVGELPNGNYLVAGYTTMHDFIAVLDNAGNLLNYYRFQDYYSIGIDRMDVRPDGRILCTGPGQYYVVDLATETYGHFIQNGSTTFELSDNRFIDYTSAPLYSDATERFIMINTVDFDAQIPTCLGGTPSGNLQLSEVVIEAEMVGEAVLHVQPNGELLPYAPTLAPFDMSITPGCTSLDLSEQELQWSLSPNPVRGGQALTIAGLPANGTLQLTDISGKAITTYAVSAGTASVDLPELGSGMYFVRYSDTHGLATSTERLFIE